jgi:hypothetical protein
MGDPDRWLNVTSDADDLERELLASVRHVGPPDGAKAAGWTAMAAQLTAAVSVGAAGAAAHSAATAEAGATSATAAKAGIGAAVSSGSTGLVTGALSKALVAKVAIALALGASTVGAGTWYMQQQRAARAGQPVSPAPEPSPASLATPPAAPAPPVEVSPEPTVNPAAAPVETAAASPAPTKRIDNGSARARDPLEEEGSLLADARAQLHGGDARAAKATLDRVRTQFPKGVLAQEREVLEIMDLAALGDADGASRKARAFSEAHPNSPHTAKLRRFIIDP